MSKLVFGDMGAKAVRIQFARREARRLKLVINAVVYFTKFVHPDHWPTINTPHCGFPKYFKSVPLSILHEAARRLQAAKNDTLSFPPVNPPFPDC